MAEKKYVTLSCEDCGTPFQIQRSWFNANKENHIWRCKKCRIEYHKRWYKNMSPEERLAVSKRMSDSAKSRWSTMSNDQYTDLCARMSIGSIAYWNDISDADYAKRCQIAKHMWDTMSEDSRLNHRMGISKSQKNRWSTMSSDDYSHMCHVLSKVAKSYWDNISDDELQKRRLDMSIRSKEYWDTMDEAEFERWKYNQSHGFADYLNTLGLYPNRNEQSFIKLLNDAGIKEWTYQHINNTIDPEFSVKYPFNCFMNTPRVNPYHRWDFSIKIPNWNILIDVDGSIHDPDKTNYMVTYENGSKFKLYEYIQFKDSQRIYQRDGNPAFIIECHDDQLTDECRVISVVNGSVDTLRRFLLKCKAAQENGNFVL